MSRIVIFSDFHYASEKPIDNGSKIVEDGITYYVVGSMNENINNDGIPDGVYFIVEFKGKELEVIEKHIRL